MDNTKQHMDWQMKCRRNGHGEKTNNLILKWVDDDEKRIAGLGRIYLKMKIIGIGCMLYRDTGSGNIHGRHVHLRSIMWMSCFRIWIALAFIRTVIQRTTMAIIVLYGNEKSRILSKSMDWWSGWWLYDQTVSAARNWLPANQSAA